MSKRKLVALIADIHWGVRGDNLAFISAHKTFFRDIFWPKIDELGIDTIINVGDTFDRRKFVNFNSLHQAKREYFDQARKRGIAHHVILGNHDTYYRSTNSINSLTLVNDVDNDPTLTIYPDPQVVTIHGHDVLMLPWINPENQAESMKMIDAAPAGSMCFAHLELNGFELHMGTRMEHGMDPKPFAKFSGVYTGHYHHRQSRDNVHYLGTPIQITWADHGDIRGFHILDLDSGELTFIENPNVMFHKLIYDDVNWPAAYKDDSLIEEVGGTYVRVMIRNKSDAYLYDQWISRITAKNPVSLSTFDEKLLSAYDDGVEIDDAESTEEILVKYVNALSVTEEQKKQLGTLLQSLYKEAEEMEI